MDAGQLGSARIVMGACRWAHSVVVSAEGRVWNFGWGMFGILGHNDEQDRLVPTLLAAEVFEASKIVTVCRRGLANHGRGRERSALGVRLRILRPAGLGDINNRRVPTLVGAEKVFGGSKVRMAACGYFHTLVVTEAGELWACGQGAQGRLGLNDGQDRLVPTRVEPQHFAHAPISAIAAGFQTRQP